MALCKGIVAFGVTSPAQNLNVIIRKVFFTVYAFGVTILKLEIMIHGGKYFMEDICIALHIKNKHR